MDAVVNDLNCFFCKTNGIVVKTQSFDFTQGMIFKLNDL